MKKVIANEELRNIMYKTINMICDAVASTIGPTGNNILISNSECSPFITNDGITIASNIESENEIENAILEIVKESSLKTNELVGDGTTTTLVLLQSIFNQGIEYIKTKKINPIILKKELEEGLKNVIKQIKIYKKKPSKKDINSIATISANDKEIGKIVSEVYNKMKSKYAIKLMESEIEKTYYEINKGYSIEINNMKESYYNNSEEITLNDVYVTIIKGFITTVEQISSIVNESYINNKNIIIFAEDIEKNIEEELLYYYLHDKKNIFIIQIAECGLHREKIEDDIKIISNCNIKNINYEDIYNNDLGYINKITITRKNITLEVNKKKQETLIDNIKKEYEISNDEYEKEFIMNRLCMLKQGIVTIYVGGITKTEKKEKIMRYEDSISAVDISIKGVIPGEGITLLNVSNNLINKTIGDNILKNALQVPFEKIITNMGQDYNSLKSNLEENNYKKIYNIETNEFEDIKQTNIIDPLEVVITALKNSVSIASILLTTNCLIVNENINRNISDY